MLVFILYLLVNLVLWFVKYCIVVIVVVNFLIILNVFEDVMIMFYFLIVVKVELEICDVVIIIFVVF